MFHAYVHRPLNTRAIQYAKDESNQHEIIEHFIARDIAWKVAKHSIYFFVDASMIYLLPGDFLVYEEGDNCPHVYRETEFLKRYRLQEEVVS